MIPDYQSLMLPVLKSAENGPVVISAVVERLAADFHLTDVERSSLLRSGKQTVMANRVQRIISDYPSRSHSSQIQYPADRQKLPRAVPGI